MKEIEKILGKPPARKDGFSFGPLDHGPDEDCAGDINNNAKVEYAGTEYVYRQCLLCGKSWYEEFDGHENIMPPGENPVHEAYAMVARGEAVSVDEAKKILFE